MEFALLAIRRHSGKKVFLGEFNSYPDAIAYREWIAPKLSKHYRDYEIEKPGHGITERPSDVELRLLQQTPVPADSSTEVVAIPQSVQIASRGIHTVADAAALISAGITDMMSDILPVKKFGAAVAGVNTLLKLAQAQEAYQDKQTGQSMPLAPRPEEMADESK